MLRIKQARTQKNANVKAIPHKERRADMLPCYSQYRQEILQAYWRM